MFVDIAWLVEDPVVAMLLPRVLGRVAAADRDVHAAEARVLLRFYRDLTSDELAEALRSAPPPPFAPGSLAAQIADPARRHAVLHVAVKMAWMDRQVHEAEIAALLEIAAALDEPPSEVGRMLAEGVAGPGRIPTAAEVRAAVEATHWEDLQVGDRPPTSALQRVLPNDAQVVAVICAGLVEQVVITDGGLAAGFVEGDAFVAWQEIRMFTREPTLAAAVKIDTRELRMHTVADARLSPLANFLDRALAGISS